MNAQLLYCMCSLSDVIERRRILAEAQERVLLARRRVELMRQAYEDSKSLLQEGKECFFWANFLCQIKHTFLNVSNTECEQLKALERSNLQREQRIKRVRQKNFYKKEAELSEELSRQSSESLRKRTELEVARRQFVNDMSRKVFPIEVESLSERDDGEGER